jgi:hypothetical protein
MTSQRVPSVRQTAAAVVLLAVALSGCSEVDEAQQAVDDAQDLVSTTKTCAELAEVAAGRLDEVREHVDDEAKLERTVRRTAEEFEAKAAEADDPQLRQALRTYVTKMRRVADSAEQGQTPDLGDLSDANGALVEACS